MTSPFDAVEHHSTLWGYSLINIELKQYFMIPVQVTSHNVTYAEKASPSLLGRKKRKTEREKERQVCSVWMDEMS